MVSPLIAQAGLEILGKGLDYLVGAKKAEKAKKARHAYRDWIGQQVREAGEMTPEIVASMREAENMLRGGMRTAGGYSPQAVAGKLAELKTNLGQMLKERQSTLETQLMSGYYGQPVPVTSVPSFTGMFRDAYNIYRQGEMGNLFKDWLEIMKPGQSATPASSSVSQPVGRSLSELFEV
jgi:hypothetical protein